MTLPQMCYGQDAGLHTLLCAHSCVFENMGNLMYSSLKPQKGIFKPLPWSSKAASALPNFVETLQNNAGTQPLQDTKLTAVAAAQYCCSLPIGCACWQASLPDVYTNCAASKLDAQRSSMSVHSHANQLFSVAANPSLPCSHFPIVSSTSPDLTAASIPENGLGWTGKAIIYPCSNRLIAPF